MENRANHILVGGIVLVLLGIMLAFTVWMASAGGSDDKKYDILFKSSVEGLAKGSSVTFSGVPVGKVEDISLLPDQPELIRVRVQVKRDTPVLQGTNATIAGVGFTGVSQINLDGAVQGAPPIDQPGPWGYPLIPPKTGGLGALLNNAPALLDRLTTLAERLNDLVNPQNQKSIGNVLAHLDTLTGALANRGPEIAATFADADLAMQQIGSAAEKFGNFADTAGTQIAPTLAHIDDAANTAKQAFANIDTAVNGVKPALSSLSTQTVPQINQLVLDLSETAASLSSLSGKLDQGGAGGLLGGPKLPDYKPRKK